MNDRDDKMITVGRLAGPHGIKGHLKFVFYGEDPNLIDQFGPLVNKKGQTFNLKRDRFHKDAWLVRLDSIPDRTAAEAVPKQDLYIERSKLPALEDDEIYYEDLIDLPVFDQDNNLVGDVVGIHDFGAGTLLEVKLAETKKTFMVPYTDDFIEETSSDKIIIKDYKDFLPAPKRDK